MIDCFECFLKLHNKFLYRGKNGATDIGLVKAEVDKVAEYVLATKKWTILLNGDERTQESIERAKKKYIAWRKDTDIDEYINWLLEWKFVDCILEGEEK